VLLQHPINSSVASFTHSPATLTTVFTKVNVTEIWCIINFLVLFFYLLRWLTITNFNPAGSGKTVSLGGAPQSTLPLEKTSRGATMKKIMAIIAKTANCLNRTVEELGVSARCTPWKDCSSADWAFKLIGVSICGDLGFVVCVAAIVVDGRVSGTVLFSLRLGTWIDESSS
jgi:hypothetical protein